jgi:hypothetical protein
MIRLMTVRTGQAGDFFAALPMMRRSRSQRETAQSSIYRLRPDAEERFRRWVGPAIEDPRTMLLVAEEGGSIIGFLWAKMEKSLPIYECDEYAVIQELWVEPEDRRNEATLMLIELAIREYAAAGVHQLRVNLPFASQGVRAAFESTGFRPATVELSRDISR